MEPQFHLGDDLNQLERALKDLTPAPARLDIAQTMFRAGQASAGRPGGWQYFWPGTSALLAVVSVTLGALLATPDQPQIVYVPVGAATAEVQTPQPALVATDGDAAPDDNWPASSTVSGAEISRPDPSWLNLMSPLLSRELAMVNLWETIPRTSPGSQPTAIPSLCSGDWRTLVGDNGSG